MGDFKDIYQLFKVDLNKLFLEKKFIQLKSNQFADDVNGHNCYHYISKYKRYSVDDRNNKYLTFFDFIGIPISSNILFVYGILKAKINVNENSFLQKQLESISENDLNSLPSSSSACIKMKVRYQKDRFDEVKRKFTNEFIVKLIEMSSLGLDDLPYEIKLRILFNLEFESLIKMSLINSKWNNLCNEEIIWKYLFRRRFPNSVTEKDENLTWKDMFKHELLKIRFERNRVAGSWRVRGLPSPPTIPALPSPPSHLALLPRPRILPRIMPVPLPLQPIPLPFREPNERPNGRFMLNSDSDEEF